LADREADRLEARGRLEKPAALHGPQRSLLARLRRPDAGRRRGPGVPRLHAKGRDHPPLLGWRDDGPDRRPGPGSAGRARSRSTVGDPRRDPGGPAGGLVSETELLSRSAPRNPSTTVMAGLVPAIHTRQRGQEAGARREFSTTT